MEKKVEEIILKRGGTAKTVEIVHKIMRDVKAGASFEEVVDKHAKSPKMAENIKMWAAKVSSGEFDISKYSEHIK